jgi:AraC-like DNA-binding protein
MLLKEDAMGEYAFVNGDMGEVLPVICGSEVCSSGHSFGPAIRDYHLVHFCLSGKGVLKDKRGTHTVQAGELFVIREGEVTTYTADIDEPWTYVWIGFKGEGVRRFADAESVYKTPTSLDERLLTLVNEGVRSREIYLSVIYELMYCIFGGEKTEDATDRLRSIRRYIKYNYMKQLSISDIACDFGLERSYLFRIFKKRYGVGPKEYLTRVRMENAARLILSGYSVSEVTAMVGYEDAFNFSGAFKKYYGVSPSKYTRTRTCTE